MATHEVSSRSVEEKRQQSKGRGTKKVKAGAAPELWDKQAAAASWLTNQLMGWR